MNGSYYKMGSYHHRIVRFLMVLTAILLTLFIYASYYSNSDMAIPTRMHLSSSAVVATAVSSSSSSVMTLPVIGGDGSPSDFVVSDGGGGRTNLETGNNNSKPSGNNSQHQYNAISDRSQINSDSADTTNSSDAQQHYVDGGAILSSPYQSPAPNLLSTNRNQTSLTGTSNSNVLPSSPLSNGRNSTTKQTQKVQLSVQVANGGSSSSSSLGSGGVSSSLSSSSSSSSSTMAIAGRHHQHSQDQLQQQQRQVDPTKGVRTSSIYEAGHMDVNPQICPEEGDTIKLLIVITSAPQHTDARLAIRQTWGHYGTRRDISVAFIIGRTVNQTIEDALTAENFIYGDLIRGHFIDSYNNLTLKTISMLEWIDHSCQHVKYVLKTDDDMFINVPKLIGFIDKRLTDKRTIFGRLAKKWKPIRNKKSKYYVSTGQFGSTIFPQFTTGPAYLMTSDIVHDLYIKSLEQTYLKLEDVFTTGIVAQLIGIKRIHVNEFLNRRIAFNPCNIRKSISVHMIKSNEQFDLWKKLLDTTTKCK